MDRTRLGLASDASAAAAAKSDPPGKDPTPSVSSGSAGVRSSHETYRLALDGTTVKLAATGIRSRRTSSYSALLPPR
jgi:hypothetical protein